VEGGWREGGGRWRVGEVVGEEGEKGEKGEKGEEGEEEKGEEGEGGRRREKEGEGRGRREIPLSQPNQRSYASTQGRS
jgi:hypothetical protein